ncbi:MAG: glycoside hydrolase family 52 protein [Bacillota bacterium]|nr:glycoside hydrolase family 52 protein [Bacillota bacterium]
MKEIYFNAQHSPIGAFSSFTLGYPNAKGGLGLELGKPADQNVYIGLQSSDGEHYDALPFYQYTEDDRKRFDVERIGEDRNNAYLIEPFDKEQIKRDFKLSTDTWYAGDLEFKIYSPARSIPDPENCTEGDLKKVILPAVFAEITIDNTNGKRSRRAFFGYKGNMPATNMRKIDFANDKYFGVGEGRNTALVSAGRYVRTAIGFSMEEILSCKLEENWTTGLGYCGAIIIDAPPGEKITIPFAICFYRGGIVTTGMEMSYMYGRFFKDIEAVAEFSIDNFKELTDACIEDNNLVENSDLTDNRKFMLAQAVRSYYGSTELLDYDGKPFWIVNEGEYLMMNTLDLTVDMVFYELRMNPWTVRNVLDNFSQRYSYIDKVSYPNDNKMYQGGISFTHDMGVMNSFSRHGHSAYEKYGISGCFSHMTHEQLVNWCCCAFVYASHTNDKLWIDKNLNLLNECFQSIINRDDADPENRDGIMGLDSSRTMGGAEITTYDSLDVSLGQARGNIYLASKCWAVYVMFENIFREKGIKEQAELASSQARKCANTIIKNINKEGFIPAVIGEDIESAIIPAVEGLIFPYFTKNNEALDENGPYGDYIKALKNHVNAIMRQGICMFEDGGWKISSTSNNSWPSKIYLCQFVMCNILEIDLKDTLQSSDDVHVSWLVKGENAYWCFSDQILSGKAIGSKYYPRGVTNILWLHVL